VGALVRLETNFPPATTAAVDCFCYPATLGWRRGRGGGGGEDGGGLERERERTRGKERGEGDFKERERNGGP